MKVETKKLDKLKRILTITVDGKTFLKDKKDFFIKIGKELKVPGFRQGTAPLDVIEKHHGKKLKEEFVGDNLSTYYAKALEQAELMPAATPRIYDVEITDEYLKFSAEVEIRPEIEIKETDYKGIKIKEKIASITNKEIDKVLDSLKDGLKKMIDKDLTKDQLAKWSGYQGVDELKEAIKAELFVEKLRQRRRNIDSLIAKHLLKAIKVDLPKAEVEKYHADLLSREMHNLQKRGASEEDLKKYEKDLEEKIKVRAQEEVKLFYILRAIAQKEDMKVQGNTNLGEVVLGVVLSLAEYS
ncbi:MAG: hypothetical protein GY858_09825 [Candidatus Omnitrophica bacterium]|nr:hypothetical protein [Candidatus Omnitrophota bacterium]